MEQHQKQSYASLYRRLLAGLCDLCLHIFIICLGLYIVALQASITDTLYALLLFVGLVLLNPFLIYHSIICLPLLGGSIGKLATGLKVVNANQQYLSFKQAFFRQTIGYQFSSILLGLGFLAIKKDPQHQAWHDKTIGSYVIIFHPYWFLGLFVSLAALLLSGLLVFQGVTTFWNGPVPQEYKSTYSSENKEINQDTTQKLHGDYFY